MKAFVYLEPAGVKDASMLAEHENTQLKAGGVDLLDLMKEGLTEPERVVNLKKTPGLSGEIAVRGEVLVLGPLATLHELSWNADVKAHAPILAMAAEQAATPQIRRAATLGGNLCQRPRCWYFRSEDFPCLKKGGDTCFAVDGENQYHAVLGNDGPCHIVHPSATGCALVAHGGRIIVQRGTNRRTIPAGEFFTMPAVDVMRENVLEPGEVIVAVEVPSAKNRKTAYHKQRERQAADWPLAEVAVSYTEEDGKVVDPVLVLGHAAPIPWRCITAENYLKGKTLDQTTAAEAARIALADAAPMGRNEYKIPLFTVLIARSLLAAAEKGEDA